MLVGAHVRAGGQLVGALQRGAAIGADVVQIFTQSPRAWKPTQYGPQVLATYRAAQAAQGQVRATYCHASYLINLAAEDAVLLERSRQCLATNLDVATGIGALGLVLHVGSHKGTGLAGCLGQVIDGLAGALEAVSSDRGSARRCPILLENAAGAGGTVGRSFEELAQILDAAGDPAGLGVCLDTQHLWASGIGFSTPEEVERVLRSFDGLIGLDRLGCLHLNDSKVPFGANRDRHENLGSGTIGEEALAVLLGHPALDHLAAVLEVPGSGDGARAEDVAAARRLVARGGEQWSAGGGRPAPGARLRPASDGPHAGQRKEAT